MKDRDGRPPGFDLLRDTKSGSWCSRRSSKNLRTKSISSRDTENIATADCSQALRPECRGSLSRPFFRMDLKGRCPLWGLMAPGLVSPIKRTEYNMRRGIIFHISFDISHLSLITNIELPHRCDIHQMTQDEFSMTMTNEKSRIQV